VAQHEMFCYYSVTVLVHSFACIGRMYNVRQCMACWLCGTFYYWHLIIFIKNCLS